MKVTWTEAKRVKTLQERGLDFARAGEVFAGLHATRTAHGGTGGESRFITAGFLDERLVVMVWTPRGVARHIHVDEVRPCEGTKALERGNGPIPMTRRN